MLAVVQTRRDQNAFRIFPGQEQVGEWTTYDGKGRIVKVTRMKSPVRLPTTAGADARRPPSFVMRSRVPLDSDKPPVLQGSRMAPCSRVPFPARCLGEGRVAC